MKSSSAKAKGRNLQDWTRDLLMSLLPTLEGGDIKGAVMGESGVDIQLSPAAKRLAPFGIECKSRATFVGYTFYDQAVANAPKGTEPMVIVKMNRRRPLVLLDAETYFKERLK